MNRTTVRVVAIVLAAGITISKFVGIGLLAEHAGFTGDSIVVLPRITVTATGMREAEHRGDTNAVGHRVYGSNAGCPSADRESDAQLRLHLIVT